MIKHNLVFWYVHKGQQSFRNMALMMFYWQNEEQIILCNYDIISLSSGKLVNVPEGLSNQNQWRANWH